MTLKLGPHAMATKQDFWQDMPAYRVTWQTVREYSQRPGYEEMRDLVAWLDKKPAVVKFCSWGKPYNGDDGFDDFRVANLVPRNGTLIIGKPMEGFRLWQGDPHEQARIYFELHFRRNIEAYPRIDVWEGPNEVGISPDQLEPGVNDMMTWYAQFLNEFARLVYFHGRRAAIGSWASGTPPAFEQWEKFRPALDACRDYHAILARHEYDVPQGPRVGADGKPYEYRWGYNNLRYRRDQAQFSRMGYGRLPVVITECGLDGVFEPEKRDENCNRWKHSQYYNGNAARYWNEFLAPYEAGLEQDDYVLGATLFTLGNGCNEKTWGPFDVAKTGLVDLICEQEKREIKMSLYMGIFKVENDDQNKVFEIFDSLKDYISKRGTPDGWCWPPTKHDFRGKTNQDIFNLFLRIFGRESYWQSLIDAGIDTTQMLIGRQKQYAGPVVEDFKSEAVKVRVLEWMENNK